MVRPAMPLQRTYRELMSEPRTAYVRNGRDDCPNCGVVENLSDFYDVKDIPVHSVILLDTEAEARTFPTRDLRLTQCSHCGFIFNRLFDPTVQKYSARYEETQGFSETFNAFSDRLARDLIQRHDLRGKRIIEIGCGKGEFLTHICELGGNSGLGYDPAYVETRSRAKPSKHVTFVKDLYDGRYRDQEADLVCCKMTLEHIPETRAFIRMLRDSLAASSDPVVFFQIPETTRLLRERAFWDIYYEHCSYFDRESLRFLFESNGFQVLDLWTDYDDQYLMIEARPADDNAAALPDLSEHEGSRHRVDRFRNEVASSLAWWKSRLSQLHSAGKTVALWGGGSKAVAFLTTLNVEEEVAAAVDINPHKHGTFLPRTGHPVVGPEELRRLDLDVVIPMNPIYIKEIRTELTALGLSPEIIPVNTSPDFDLSRE
jgi:SAM-dependent methyltransferase